MGKKKKNKKKAASNTEPKAEVKKEAKSPKAKAAVFRITVICPKCGYRANVSLPFSAAPEPRQKLPQHKHKKCEVAFEVLEVHGVNL